jgi:hypothetical protein
MCSDGDGDGGSGYLLKKSLCFMRYGKPVRLIVTASNTPA